MKAYIVTETVTSAKEWMFNSTIDFCNYIGFYGGSYITVAARICGLPLYDFYRYVRDTYNAEIVGKDRLYPCLYFKSRDDAEKLVNLLNNRWDKIKDFYYKS